MLRESALFQELAGRINELSYAEEMSLLWHPASDESRTLAMMTACYGDESDDTHKKQAYVVSGLLASGVEWVELERRWKSALADEGLTEFHASKCEQGREPFDQYDWLKRQHFQRRFYGIIAGLNIWGYSAAINLVDYGEYRQIFDRNRPDYSQPYFLGFQLALELTCNALEDPRSRAGSSDVVSYVFDQHREYQDRAKNLYDSVLERSTDSALPWRRRLGSLAFDSRLRLVALQAGDVFAYESRKWVSDVKLQNLPDTRWQWHTLRDTNRFGVWTLTKDSFGRLCESQRWT